MLAAPARAERCGACGAALSVDREGVVSCVGACVIPMYGDSVGLNAGERGLEVFCVCGYRGSPTFKAGRPVLECPRCDPWLEAYPAPPAGSHWVIRRRRARGPAPPRNAPCPCGSGVKAKKCCWR